LFWKEEMARQTIVLVCQEKVYLFTSACLFTLTLKVPVQ